MRPFAWLGSLLGERKNALMLDRLPSLMLSPEAKSGVAVGFSSALTVPVVLAAVRLVANGIAQVPLRAYVRSQARIGRLKRIDHPLLDLLGWRPNAWQTAFEFVQTLVLHLLLTGNAFVYKSLAGDGRILELILIEPRHVVMVRQPDMSIVYEVGSDAGVTRRLTRREIWHLRGLSSNGWAGLDIVRQAREAIGLALATEEAHALLHRNGVQAGSVLSVDGKLTAEQHKLLQGWVDAHIGGSNRFKPLIVDGGGKWTSTRMTGVDAEHLATRKFQIEEVCRTLGVIPMMVGSTEKNATYASAEQMFIAHVVHTLAPWARCIELSAEVNLLGADEDVDLAFDLKGLMRGASKDRAEYNAKALGSGGGDGWATQNELREDEGYDWHPDGDTLPKRVVASAASAPAPIEGTA